MKFAYILTCNICPSLIGWSFVNKIIKCKYVPLYILAKNLINLVYSMHNRRFITFYTQHISFTVMWHQTFGIKDYSDSERGNQLPPIHGLFVVISSKGSSTSTILHRQDSTYHGLYYTSYRAIPLGLSQDHTISADEFSDWVFAQSYTIHHNC